MSDSEQDIELIRAAAFAIALEGFSLSTPLTPEEKEAGPEKLRACVDGLIAEHRNPETLAVKALGKVRQEQQIARSKARILSRKERSGNRQVVAA